MRKIIKFLKSDSNLWYELCAEIENSLKILLSPPLQGSLHKYYGFLSLFFIILVTLCCSFYNTEFIGGSSLKPWDKVTLSFSFSFLVSFLLYLMILSILNFKRKWEIFTVGNFFRIIYGFFEYTVGALISFLSIVFLVYDFGLYAEVALEYLSKIFEFASSTGTPLLGIFIISDSDQLVQILLTLSLLGIFISLLGIYTILSFSMTGIFLNRKHSKQISKWGSINIFFSFYIIILLYIGFTQAMDSDSIVKFKSFRAFNYAFYYI